MKRQIHAVRGHEEIAVAGPRHQARPRRHPRDRVLRADAAARLRRAAPAAARPAHARHAGRACAARAGSPRRRATSSRTPTASCARSSTACRWSPTSRRSACPPTRTTLSASPGSAASRTARRSRTALARTRAKVQRHYALLFEEGPELASEAGSLVFTGVADDPETLATLRAARVPPSGAGGRDGARLAFRPPLRRSRAPAPARC